MLWLKECSPLVRYFRTINYCKRTVMPDLFGFYFNEFAVTRPDHDLRIFSAKNTRFKLQIGGQRLNPTSRLDFYPRRTNLRWDTSWREHAHFVAYLTLICFATWGPTTWALERRFRPQWCSLVSYTRRPSDSQCSGRPSTSPCSGRPSVSQQWASSWLQQCQHGPGGSSRA